MASYVARTFNEGGTGEAYGVETDGRHTISCGSRAEADKVAAALSAYVAPDPLADFIAACKAASTLDDLKTLRATFAATPFPGTTHTTARSALNVADRRINRS